MKKKSAHPAGPSQRQLRVGELIRQALSEMLAHGYREWRRLLNAYALCLASDEWPGYSPSINPLKLPGFVKV